MDKLTVAQKRRHQLPFFQDEGPIHLPSVYIINGVRMQRLPLKRGPKGGHHDKNLAGAKSRSGAEAACCPDK